MNRPTSHTTSPAVFAIAAAAFVLASGGCGGSVSGASKPAVASKQATVPAATAPAPSNKLLATVSATGAEATLTDSSGRPLTRVPSGWYTIFVTVNAAGADFHLSGPSVNSTTKSKIPGVALWGIHLLKGAYRYMNDHDTRTTTHVLSVY